MCGIIGYVGPRACKPLLLQGLERLEYRGYDSAGLALLEVDGLDYVREVGNLQKLKQRAERQPLRSDDRCRAHALGDPRACLARKRAPADRLRRRRDVDRPERDRRELPRAEGVTRRRGAHLLLGDRCGGCLAPDRAPLPGRPRRCRSSRPTRSSRGTSRSSPSTATTRARSSARAARRRSSSESARARCSLPPRSPRSCPRPAASSSSTTTRSSS